jgi:hypothetical protein
LSIPFRSELIHEAAEVLYLQAMLGLVARELLLAHWPPRYKAFPWQQWDSFNESRSGVTHDQPKNAFSSSRPSTIAKDTPETRFAWCRRS